MVTEPGVGDPASTASGIPVSAGRGRGRGNSTAAAGGRRGGRKTKTDANVDAENVTAPARRVQGKKKPDAAAPHSKKPVTYY